MHTETPIVLSIVAALVGLLGGLVAAVSYANLSRKHAALKAQVQALVSKTEQDKQVTLPSTEDVSHEAEDRKLLKILEDFNERRFPDSVCLKRAMPLLVNRISSVQQIWLEQELDGYKMEAGFTNDIPSYMTYRLVYADELKMAVKGTIRADLSWPPAANRLLVVQLPLAEIEKKLADRSTDYFMGGAGIRPAGLPADVDAVGLFHKCQLQRLASRFRQEFSKLLCSVLRL